MSSGLSRARNELMSAIRGDAKSIRGLLSGARYSIDYYQREYRWERKQVTELVEDLSQKFLDHFDPSHERPRVEQYGQYFLGSIIVSRRGGVSYIVDGQQRLTTLTLLLTFLNNLQKEQEHTDTDMVELNGLIFSERFGRRSFNLDVEERTPCMESLFLGQSYDTEGKPESVQNLVERYNDIEAHFPIELTEDALPFFIDWVTESIYLVEISADTDEDAYTIFETMNDRGLSLAPSEMLKGYLLANITDDSRKSASNAAWKTQIDSLREFQEFNKEIVPDFFKSWLRSQFADTIRERRKGASAGDFDRIGTEFHRWVRDHRDRVGLDRPSDFSKFIDRDLDFYARQYTRIVKAADDWDENLEHVFYLHYLGFTLRDPVLLAPLTPEDSESVVIKKIQVTGIFLEALLARRIWNYKSLTYSTMNYAMFLLMREIRGMALDHLAPFLANRLETADEQFDNAERFGMHQRNRYPVRHVLARITSHIERESDLPSRYDEYVYSDALHRSEIEHIWADHYERHTDEFDHPEDFSSFRNRIGGLILLPKSINASYGDMIYEDKLPHYFGQNLLASSLNSQAYERNPGFLRYLDRSKLPFRPHENFGTADLEARQSLYIKIADEIWHPDRILEAAES